MTMLVAFVGLLILSALPAHAEILTFASAELGASPGNFEFWRTGDGRPGQWRVVRDPSAEGGKALEQTSTDKTDYRFPLAIYKPFSGDNVAVSVRFKPISGTVDQAGGLAIRLTTPDDYYVVRANALEDNVRFYRVVKGKREQLQSASVKVASNQWHVLGIRAEGSRFTITYDGRTLYTATDRTFGQAGKVALWTKADSVTRFDRLEFGSLP
jgi:hypothetical protein